MISVKNVFLYYIAFFVTLVAFVLYFVGMEDNVYYWDYNGFWRMWEFFSSAHVSQWSHMLLQSINNDDYNLFPVLPIFPFYYFPFPSRMDYILSIMVIYTFPFIVYFCKFYSKFDSINNGKELFLILSVISTAVVFMAPTVFGLPDIGGSFFTLLASVYVVNNDFCKKFNLRRAIILGILLWLPFLFRRWYAYTVISLYVSLPLLNFFLYKLEQSVFKSIRSLLGNFFLSGMISTLLVVSLQTNLFFRMLDTDYSYIYSAYQMPFYSSVKSLIYYVGLYNCYLFLLGGLFVFFSKNKRIKILFSFCVFNLVFSFFLFTRTQAPGIHHVMPNAVWIFLISVYAVLSCIRKLRFLGAGQNVVLVMFCCLVFFVAYNSFFVESGFSYSSLNELMPRKNLPLRVHNAQGYKLLSRDVESLMKDNATVMILSSNGILNDDMLNTLSGRRLTPHLHYAAQVDLRDGIRPDEFQSKFVVVVDPPQTHLGGSGQRVIVIPNDDILHGKAIGKAYKKLEYSYELAPGVHAYIYERQRNFTLEEVEEFLGQFYDVYPQWRVSYPVDKFYKETAW